MKNTEKSRRNFLQAVGVGAACLVGDNRCLGQVGSVEKKKKSKPKFELGLTSYTLREFNLEDTLAMTRRVGLKNICFKSMHLELDSTPAQIRAAVQKVKDAGLNLYGGGVIGLKKEGQINQAFDYAKAAGMKVIIAAPSPEMLPLIEKKVQQYDIKVAIHNHGPGDNLFPTPAVALEHIKNLDMRIGMCHDIGHTKRYGSDPIAETRLCGDRLHDVHIKDVSAANKNGHGVEVGRGVINIPGFLRTIIKMNYDGVVSFYIKGVLAALGN